MGFEEYFGTLGMLFAFILAVSPIPGLYQGYKDMEINNITYTYLLCAISNCSLWFLYGLKKNDYYILITNGSLLFIFSIYFAIFLFIKKIENYKILACIIGIIVTDLFIKSAIPMDIIGTLAFIFNSAWALCAIETLRECLKKKDSRMINIQISFVSTVNSYCWLFYGILSENIFVVIPNVIGSTLWSANLIAYYWSIEKIRDKNIFIYFLQKILIYNDESDNNYTKMESFNRKDSHGNANANAKNHSQLLTTGQSHPEKMNI